MGENGATDETREIQVPPAAGDTPTRVDTPQVAASPDPLAAAAAGPGEKGRLRRRLRQLKAVGARQRVELGTLTLQANATFTRGRTLHRV